MLVAMSSTTKSYFDRKKRDLKRGILKKDEEWCTIRERKKARKTSLDLSLSKKTNYDTYVLTEGLEFPRFVSTQCDCSKNLESKANEVYKRFSLYQRRQD